MNELSRFRKPNHLRFVLVALALTIAAGMVIPWDDEIAQFLYLDELPGDVHRVVHLAEIFGHGFCIMIVLVGIWLLSPRDRRFLPRIASMAILPGLVVQVLKSNLVRPRPIQFLPDLENIGDVWIRWVTDSWNSQYLQQSFPSGHTATAVGLAIGLGSVYPRGRALFYLLAALTAFQRVADNAHWTGDVLAGAAIAVSTSWLLLSATPKLFGWIENRGDRERISD